MSDKNSNESVIEEIKERYRGLSEASFEAIFISEKGICIEQNQAAEKMFGYTAKEAIGRYGTDWIAVEDRETVMKNMLGGYEEPYEVIALKKDGSTFPCLLRGKMMQYQGRTVRVTSLSDITERKQAEKALKESEEKFRSYTENAPYAILVINPSGFYLDANPAACKLLGYSLEELLQMNVSQVFHEEDLILFRPGIEILLKEGKYTNEFKFVRKDGSCFIAQLSAAIINENKFMGFVTDVTEKRKAEEALRESEYFFKETQRVAFIGSYSTDFKTGFWKSSEILDKILGIDLNYNRSIQGWLDLVYPDDREMMDNYLREDVIIKQQHFNKEYRIKRQSDGEIRWVKGMGKVEFSSEGDLLSMIGTIQDITERKKVETAFIESQRLGAIGEMTSSIAHDFNNSLQSILGNLELAMLDTDHSECSSHYLKTIKTVINDASIRVKLLQRFSGKGQFESKYSQVNINTLIEEVISQTRPLWKDDAEKNGLTISVQTAFSEIPKIYGSVGELRSAFYNIIKNSVEAMPGGGKIVIETSRKFDGVKVSITDTGIGMDEETKVRIFQPFYTTKGFELGRGLGMSGVYSIVKEHKGDIFIKNTAVGKGTELELHLPFSSNQEGNIIADIETKVKNRLRVLWVEDDAIIRKSAEKMVERLGHHVDPVKSGNEALEFLEQNCYDLVITDIGMPGMNGWQLATQIKEKFEGKIKVAVVTGWSSDIDESIKQEHGVEYILGKPFSIQELQKLLSFFS